VVFGLQATSLKKEPAGLTIQGKVVQEPDAQPVRKANVQLIAQGGQFRGQYSAITDAEGRFAIDGVKPGRYIVTIDHPGLVQTGSGRLFASLSQDASDLILHVQPAAVITGKITDADGDPMRDVAVTATRVGLPQAGTRHDSGNGSTNDLGEFRISDLRPGRYTVVAMPQRNVPVLNSRQKGKGEGQFVYVTTYYPGTWDKDQSVAVDVQTGSETPVNFSVLTSKAYRVTGEVRGLPTADVTQIILTSENGFDSEQQLGAGGKFDLPSVLPGSYQVHLIVVSGFGAGGQPGMQVMAVNQSIEVSKADIEGLRLQVDSGGPVRGRFQMDTGQKFDWTQLTVMLLNLDQRSGIELGNSFQRPTFSSVAKDGTFEMKNVPSGKYYLVVGARGSSNNLRDYFTKAVMLDGQEVGDSGFSTSPGTYLEVIISAKGATIEGTVVDGKGKPVASATVVDVPSPDHRLRPDLYQQDTTDEQGHFSLRGLNPGSYTVLAFEDLEESVRDPKFLESYGSQGQKIELDEAAAKSVVLKLIPAGAD